MAFLPAQGAEPIPGYRLEKQLGTSGYGEVWQVTAPGKLVKAMKIIFGDTADTCAAHELRALNRTKEVRHPFLLSLGRVEIVDNQLFIVTELADERPMNRFEACRRSAPPGIPREDLLPSLRDAADAQDYMNEQ
jgi:hypothetical protein